VAKCRAGRGGRIEGTVQSVHMLCMGTSSLHALVQANARFEHESEVGRLTHRALESGRSILGHLLSGGREVCSGIKESVHR
jgi:hypothetical protein